MTEVKMTISGDAQVGKTQIFNKILNNEFNSIYEPTVGADMSKRKITANGKDVTLVIHDTSGNDHNAAIPRTYYRNAHICLIVFDVSYKQSLENSKKFIELAKKFAENPLIVLVGNKTDCDGEVSQNEAQEFASENGIGELYFVSAKTGDYIENLVYDLVPKVV